jgi:hypothetical protein
MSRVGVDITCRYCGGQIHLEEARSGWASLPDRDAHAECRRGSTVRDDGAPAKVITVPSQRGSDEITLESRRASS